MQETVTKIRKDEARRRYDAGLPIAMAGEPWWFDHDRVAYTFTRDEMHATFEELHNGARGDARFSYAKPITQAEIPVESIARVIREQMTP